MKVFLSWSGTKAKIVATAMRSFLQDVNQRTDVWFSASDISPGDRWGLQLATELESTDYGIICLTQESLHRPWPIFEAGALAKSVADGRVCPYLIDVSMSQLSGPLAQFQAKLATKDETWELLQAVNLAMASDALPESRLKKYFDTFWPNLAEVLSRVDHEFQVLPRDIRARLLEVLPPAIYRVDEIELLALMADLPVWEINLKQAAIHVWPELIDLAVAQKKLEFLLDAVAADYRYPILIQSIEKTREELRSWNNSQS